MIKTAERLREEYERALFPNDGLGSDSEGAWKWINDNYISKEEVKDMLLNLAIDGEGHRGEKYIGIQYMSTLAHAKKVCGAQELSSAYSEAKTNNFT